jgi:hypothetical protein
MAIENEGQGVDLPSLGAKSLLKSSRDWITGDAQYNRYMEQHSSNNASDTPRNASSDTPRNTSSDNVASHTDEVITDTPSREHSSEEHTTDTSGHTEASRETSRGTSEPTVGETIHTELENRRREG